MLYEHKININIRETYKNIFNKMVGLVLNYSLFPFNCICVSVVKRWADESRGGPVRFSDWFVTHMRRM